MQNSSFLNNLFKGISARIKSLFTHQGSKAGLNWFSEKFLKHAPAGVIRSYQYRNKKIYYSNPSEFLHALKEIFIHEIYKGQYSPGSYIIDCGANIGLSVIYLKQICPDAKIVAFEPDEENFKLLQDNISSFDFKNVTLRKEAVWIENTQLHFAGLGSMSSRIGDAQGAETNVVTAIRLKELLTEPVDFLKIDIEGAEYEVLKDIKEQLYYVKNMFLEYHGSFKQTAELTALLSWITAQGFSYYIKEAADIYSTPFDRTKKAGQNYDVQLNIFCFRPVI